MRYVGRAAYLTLSGPSVRLLGVAFLLISFAYLWMLQRLGCSSAAHYALVKSLANGTPSIDTFQRETCDKSFVDGHFYASKAPGLAFVALPAYLVVKAVGALPGDPENAIWLLHVVATVLPALVVLFLTWLLARRFDPELAPAAPAILGLATLLLPYATIFFAHALSAALLLGAFALLWTERSGPPRLGLLWGAGVLAGLAVTTEFPTVFVGAVLFVYAVARAGWPKRAAAYGLGALLGVAPTLAFSWWAFGSPFRSPYENAVAQPGATGHDVIGLNSAGFFGIVRPSLTYALELLFSTRGLLILTPVVALGAIGIVLLYRKGFRAEALTIAGVALVTLVWNSSYVHTLGSDSAGPRFLVPVLPFVLLPVGLVLRRFPLTTVALTLISAFAMSLATSTEILLGIDDTSYWTHAAIHGNFAHTLATVAGLGHGWLSILPFFLAVGAALVLIGYVCRPQLEITRAEAVTATIVVAAWALVWREVPGFVPTEQPGHTVSRGLVVAFVVAVVAAALLLVRRRAAGVLPAAAAVLVLAASMSSGAAVPLLWALTVAAVGLVGARALRARFPTRPPAGSPGARA